ncbi:MAG: 2-methylaconitate cis-trans isomerase PrpF [Rhodocyclaceae bacterium]|nr:2-methylaconitate cis-trans isomerase PrpF [Rhodocyclaceae bacterium]MBX3668087.1 2-methylaconitate cis-trans isomerase PrpF [Rhodocyclaceae bacterium]
MKQLRIPAVYMRGGTSKGVFFLAGDLPADPALRERVLLRVIGSPDPYGKHIDGMGGATSSTSKVVIVGRSTRPDCDVDYLFGQVAVDRPVIDWSGNCGNLTAAVGPFAIASGLLPAAADGLMRVRIWQANVGRKIAAEVPVQGGEVQETGQFELDGVAFPAAEVRLEFLDPAAEDGSTGGALFPTGARLDKLDVPGLGQFEATLINAGNPAIFIAAEALGLSGTELPAEVNGNAALLARAEAIRCAGALAMGLVHNAEQAAQRMHTPKLAVLAPPAAYTSSSGKRIEARDMDFLARIFSMGQLHHAMTGTGAVALAVAAAIPGTLVSRYTGPAGRGEVRFGHPSGLLQAGAVAEQIDGNWVVRKAVMSRSARRIMEGWVRIPPLPGWDGPANRDK